MKAFLLFAHTGPLLILSKYDSINQPELLSRLTAFGKFIAYEMPIEAIQSCYSSRFQSIFQDPRSNEAMIVLDENGESIFNNISLRVLGSPTIYEPGESVICGPLINK
ncbi:MAG: hypothetical protein PHU23_09965 [Dehalococcoidales bacterium]|nr:hypothetical protein [Dehalococcoidales bacterium]